MSASTPAISVVLPTHNRRELLARSLESVLAQTWTDLEVIVVDNASNDGTAEYLRSVADRRVRTLRLPELRGASAARNAGLAAGSSPLVAFQDDDDFWFPHKLAEQVRALEAAGPQVGLCLCGLIRLNPSGVHDRYTRKYFEQIDFAAGVILNNFSVIATPGWLVRREILARAGGFDEKLPARNDWELALRLRDLCRFTYVEGPLFVQDQRHLTTMQRNQAAQADAVRRIVAVHGHRWARQPRVTARHAEIIGRYELLRGNVAEGRRWLARAVRTYPWRLRPALLWLASLVGATAYGRIRHSFLQLRSR